MIVAVLDSDSAGYGEIDLICTLNKDRALDAELRQVKAGGPLATRTVREAARACLGSAEARARVLKALASPDERDVRIAQAYLRHRPIADDKELRSAALTVAKMPGSNAQVRALETLARQRIGDREVLEELQRLYTRASSPDVQRAIAEIFIRSADRSFGTPEFIAFLRRFRLSEAANDLVDVLIAQLLVQIEHSLLV
jgi:HEAT repeat protein